MQGKLKVPITRRKFLGSSPSMKSMNWTVETSLSSGKASGQFSLAWGRSCVVIHTLGAVCPNADMEYVDKLNSVITAFKDFSLALANNTQTTFRDWLNPLETGATGSVAYQYSGTGDETLIYFELASCDDKIRIYPYQFPEPQLLNMRKCLETIAIELSSHRFTYTRLMEELDTVNIEQTG